MDTAANSVKNSVAWRWNNADCVIPGGGGYEYNRFRQSGWTLFSDSRQSCRAVLRLPAEL
ncbi:hypothetical protein GCM10017600_22530 [Streptosporangium carneum]|uniref:Uncharacterized protein n=1 Tax=Streptosporangium carneum TaxID=47481 RepID=A0A9W6MCK7_9ACTN|nr:hypothetical protein GCM10017600_22530 [Streptosporangium carneum]